MIFSKTMDKFAKSFEGRRSTLRKKAGALADRCKIEVCVVCFGPNGDLEVWPENPTKAQSIIEKYKEASKKGNKCRRKEKLNLSDVLESKIKSLEKQLHEEETNWDFSDNGTGGLSLWDEELNKLTENSLKSLSNCLEAKIRMIELIKGKQTIPSDDFSMF